MKVMKIKALLLHLAVGALIVVSLSFAQGPTELEADMSGFSGYAWGTSIEFIVSTMQDEDYDLISGGHKDLWYRGKIVGKPLQLVYYFQDGLLVSGMWIFDDVDSKSYWKVNEFLRNEYNAKATLRIRDDDWIESEFAPPGTHAWILHKLDIERGQHIVNYYFRHGAD